MNFTYKSEQELASMSEDQRKQYAIDRDAYVESKSTEKAKTELGVLKNDLETKIKDAIKSNNDGISELKTELEDKIKQIDRSIEDIGKQNQVQVMGVNKFYDELTEKMQEAFDVSKGNKSNLNGYEFTIKDDAAFTHTVSTVPASVYPSGSNANVTSEFLISYGQRVGTLAGAPLPMLNLLDYIDVLDLTGQYLINDVLYNPVGDAEFVPECGLKPLAKEDVKIESSKAGKVAIGFRLSEEYQRFIPQFVKNKIRGRYEELLHNAMVKAIFSGSSVDPNFKSITLNASAFTPSPSHVIFDNPNHFDALACAVNSLELRNYKIRFVAMNSSEKIALLNVKGNDGHYATFNNGSIQLLNGRLAYVNGGVYPIVFDKTIPQGKLFIASYDTFEVAADDTTTVRFGYNKDGDLQRNILTVFLEKFMAVSAPAEVGDGLLYDTFDNIKEAITV